MAKVKLYTEGSGAFSVNGRNLDKYFPGVYLQKAATDPLALTGLLKKVDVEAKAQGGGILAQAQAVSLGAARALVKFNSEFKLVLKKQGLLTRDAREKERKKPGLKRARRAPQWQKR